MFLIQTSQYKFTITKLYQKIAFRVILINIALCELPLRVIRKKKFIEIHSLGKLIFPTDVENNMIKNFCMHFSERINIIYLK